MSDLHRQYGFSCWKRCAVRAVLTLVPQSDGMNTRPDLLSPDAWLLHLFQSQAACEGNVIRRKVRDVERYVGRDAFLAEMKRRGYPVVENAGQFVIF